MARRLLRRLPGGQRQPQSANRLLGFPLVRLRLKDQLDRLGKYGKPFG